MNLTSEHSFLCTLKLGGAFCVLVLLVCGCSDKKAEVKKAVENLLQAAYNKNYDTVRQSIDFDRIIDSYLLKQGPAGKLDNGQREKIIDEIVKSACEITREDLEKAMASLRVEIDTKNVLHAAALYDSSKKSGVLLSLEKRKAGWIVTEIR